MKRTDYKQIRVIRGGVADRILTFLQVPHVRLVPVRGPEEYLVKYMIITRRNMENGNEQREELRRLLQVCRRAALRGAPFSPDDMLAFMIQQETTPMDAGLFMSWLISEEFIKPGDVELLK